ncbi:MAG TPA: glycosyltransferase 87 family protein [Candidatus Dormibacteraeota bacterium]|nr:glycosyltransferase 87 family protein [Candidatus Dormibacteraeota bacterium]
MSAALARPVTPQPRPATDGLRRRADMLLLLVLAVPTAYVDWQIVRVWSWPPVWSATWLGLTLLAAGLGVVWLDGRELVAPLVAASLYAGPIITAIARLHFVPSPVALIGDGALQTQQAGDLLLHGTDPYGADYAALGLGRTPWAEPFPNPALHHTVFWPGQFLLPLPLQSLSQTILHWWDQRVFLLLAGVAIWILLRQLLPGTAGRAAALVFFLVPGHSLVAVLGDNDLAMVALLLGALFAAQRRRFLIMGLLLGLAVATKQHAVLAAPFIVWWALARGASLPVMARSAAGGMAALMAVLLPFVLWNPHAFIQDTVVFVTGGGADAYPINGFGLSAMLLSAGVIHGSRDSFPFAPIEAVVGIALWAWGYVWIRARRQLPDVLIFSGLTALLVLFVSRYFHDTHLLLGLELMGSGFIGRLRVLQP